MWEQGSCVRPWHRGAGHKQWRTGPGGEQEVGLHEPLPEHAPCPTSLTKHKAKDKISNFDIATVDWSAKARARATALVTGLQACVPPSQPCATAFAQACARCCWARGSSTNLICETSTTHAFKRSFILQIGLLKNGNKRERWLYNGEVPWASLSQVLSLT